MKAPDAKNFIRESFLELLAGLALSLFLVGSYILISDIFSEKNNVGYILSLAFFLVFLSFAGTSIFRVFGYFKESICLVFEFLKKKLIALKNITKKND